MYDAEKQRRRRAEKMRSGECIDCLEKAETGKRRCDYHLSYQVELSRRKRERAKQGSRKGRR